MWPLRCCSAGFCHWSSRFASPSGGTLSHLLSQDIPTSWFIFPATLAISFLIPMGLMLFTNRIVVKAAQRQARWIHAIDHMGSFRWTGGLWGLTQPDESRFSLKKEIKSVKTLGLIVGFILFVAFFFCINVDYPLKSYNNNPVVLEPPCDLDILTIWTLSSMSYLTRTVSYICSHVRLQAFRKMRFIFGTF